MKQDIIPVEGLLLVQDDTLFNHFVIQIKITSLTACWLVHKITYHAADEHFRIRVLEFPLYHGSLDFLTCSEKCLIHCFAGGRLRGNGLLLKCKENGKLRMRGWLRKKAYFAARESRPLYCKALRTGSEPQHGDRQKACHEVDRWSRLIRLIKTFLRHAGTLWDFFFFLNPCCGFSAPGWGSAQRGTLNVGLKDKLSWIETRRSLQLIRDV